MVMEKILYNIYIYKLDLKLYKTRTFSFVVLVRGRDSHTADGFLATIQTGSALAGIQYERKYFRILIA